MILFIPFVSTLLNILFLIPFSSVLIYKSECDGFLIIYFSNSIILSSLIINPLLNVKLSLSFILPKCYSHFLYWIQQVILINLLIFWYKRIFKTEFKFIPDRGIINEDEIEEVFNVANFHISFMQSLLFQYNIQYFLRKLE